MHFWFLLFVNTRHDHKLIKWIIRKVKQVLKSMMETLCRLLILVGSQNLTFQKSTTLKQWFLLHYKFLQCQIMTNIILVKFAKELKLIKVVAISRYRQSWWSSTMLFGNHKGFYCSQWLLTGWYFKHCTLENNVYHKCWTLINTQLKKIKR